MIERPTKEWIERIGSGFPRVKPKSISLRGDGSRMHGHEYELLLARIHFNTKRLFKSKNDWSYYKREKLIVDQQQMLYMMCYDFEVPSDRVFTSSRMYFDFVVRPGVTDGLYPMALADKILTTDDSEISMLLEFQFQNLVIVEGFEEISFLQILRTYVPLYLNTRYPEPLTEKSKILNDWIWSKVSSLGKEKKIEMFWYPVEYGTETGSHEKVRLKIEKNYGKHIRINSNSDVGKSIGKWPEGFPDLSVDSRVFHSCPFEHVAKYFSILEARNPITKEPLVAPQIIQWMLAKYFTDSGTLAEKPMGKMYLNKHDWLIFVYNFSIYISSIDGTHKRTPIKDLISMLGDAFPDVFPQSSWNGCYRNMQKTYRDSKSKIRTLLDISKMEDWNNKVLGG